MRFIDIDNYVHFVDLDDGDVFINSDAKIVMKVGGPHCPFNAVILDSGKLDCYFDKALVYKVNATCSLNV